MTFTDPELSLPSMGKDLTLHVPKLSSTLSSHEKGVVPGTEPRPPAGPPHPACPLPSLSTDLQTSQSTQKPCSKEPRAKCQLLLAFKLAVEAPLPFCVGLFCSSVVLGTEPGLAHSTQRSLGQGMLKVTVALARPSLRILASTFFPSLSSDSYRADQASSTHLFLSRHEASGFRKQIIGFCS